MWHRADVVAFDTETTGFGPEARVVEVGVVRMREGVILEKWSQLIDPGNVDWSSERVQKALEINKLKREELEGQPTFSEVVLELLNRLSYSHLVAHNTPFDLQMLRQELDRLKIEMPTWALTLDTCSLDFRVSGGQGFKLANSANRWGVTQTGAHRAGDDAETCGRILWAMIQKQELPFDLLQVQAFQINASSDWQARFQKRK